MIECKECKKPCKSGKRGLCDTHYALYIKSREKQKQVVEKAKVRKAKIKEKKQGSISRLTSVLDKVFSLYVRLRDTDKDGNGYCCTSGEWKEWSSLQCGHCFSRRFMSTRWHPKNCHAQSVRDNVILHGEQYKHTLYIDNKYGKGSAEKLYKESQEIKKWTSFELKELVDYYTAEVRELIKTKDFEVNFKG